jgi:hypothetical protein
MAEIALPEITIRPGDNADAWPGVPVAAGSGNNAEAWPGVPVVTDTTNTSPLGQYGSDVGHSLATDLGKGIMDLYGMPSDVRSAVLSGIEGLHGTVVDALDLPPDRAAELKKNLHDAIDFSMNQAGASKAATTAEIKGAFEKKFGPLYQSQTLPGQYAGAIAEFAPAALIGGGGGSVARRFITQDVVPAVASEAAGQMSAVSGTPMEPIARAAGAIGGGALGALVGSGGTAARAIRSQLPDYVTPQHIDRAQGLMTAAKTRGIDLTWPEALSKVTGKPVLTDMQRIIESAARTRAPMQAFFGERPAQIENAGRAEFGALAPTPKQPSTIGPQASQAAEGVLSDVRGAINNFTKPFYDKAAKVMLTAAEMAKVRAIPGFEDAAKAIHADPQLERYVSGLPENSVGFLNEVKKYLDTAQTNAASPMTANKNAQRAAGFGMDAAAVRKAAEAASLDYTTALAVQQHAREKYLEPLLKGPLGRIADQPDTRKATNALFPSNPTPNSAGEVSTAVSALANKNQWAATQLVRAHAESVFNEATQALQSGPNQAGGAKFVARLVGNPQQRENLRAAVEALPNGADKWQGFEKFLDIVEATGTRQAIGSKTAFNAQELAQLGGGGAVSEIVKTGASPGKWMTLVHDKWSRWQFGNNLDDLARIITDPKSGPLLQSIAKLPVDSREGLLTTLRIIAQSQNAASRDERRNLRGQGQ